MMHICTVCFGQGRFQAKACPMCKGPWRSRAVRTPQEFNRGIGSNYVVKDDPLLFGGFERGWDLESTQLDFLENAFTVDTGGVLVQQPVPPEMFKTQVKSLEPVLSRTKANDKLKFDVFRDRKTGYSHLYRAAFDAKEWSLNADLPKGRNAITHVGVFKDSRAATDFLKRKYGIEV